MKQAAYRAVNIVCNQYTVVYDVPSQRSLPWWKRPTIWADVHGHPLRMSREFAEDLAAALNLGRAARTSAGILSVKGPATHGIDYAEEQRLMNENR